MVMQEVQELVHQVHPQVLQVQQVLQVITEPQELAEVQEQVVLQVQMVLMVQLVFLDQVELQVLLVQQVQMVLQEQLHLPVQVQQVLLQETSGTNGTSGGATTAGTSSTSRSSGTTGTNGTSGAATTDGASSISRTSGTTGSNGTSGGAATAGVSTISATSGTSGTNGTSGAAGVAGASNTSRSSGTSGTSGTNGTAGAAGSSAAGATSGTSGSAGSSGVSINGTAGISGGTFNNQPGYAVYTSSSVLVQSVSFVYYDFVNSRVGFGTTSPTAKVHIVNNSTSESPLEIENDNVSGYAQIIYDGQGNANTWNVGTGGSSVATLGGHFFWYYGGTKMILTNTGRLGVGTSTPSYPVDVNGNVSGISIYASDDIVAFSDTTVKGDVKVIENAIEKIKEIRGVTFIRTDRQDTQRHAGVIAQEVQKVLPEVVTTRTDDGTLAVAYGNLNALLIEAIKELTFKVEKLEQQLKDK
jgi:hypothetical protein